MAWLDIYFACLLQQPILLHKFFTKVFICNGDTVVLDWDIIDFLSFCFVLPSPLLWKLSLRSVEGGVPTVVLAGDTALCPLSWQDMSLVSGGDVELFCAVCIAELSAAVFFTTRWLIVMVLVFTLSPAPLSDLNLFAINCTHNWEISLSNAVNSGSICRFILDTVSSKGCCQAWRWVNWEEICHRCKNATTQ